MKRASAMSTSEPNNSAPPSPDDPGVAGDVLSPTSLLAPRCTLLVQGLIGSFNSQVHSEQPHVQGAPPACVRPANTTETKGCGDFVPLANAGINTTSITTVPRQRNNLDSFIIEVSPLVDVGALRQTALFRADTLFRLLAKVKDITYLTWVLIRLAEIAYGARDFVTLDELSQVMLAIPRKSAQDAARYYAAVIAKRVGQLDHAIELLSTLNQPRAIQTLATVCENRGEWGEAIRLHVEAMRVGQAIDTLAVINAQLQLSAFKSLDGDHQASLEDLQRLHPFVALATPQHPHLWPLFHNDLAFELLQLGRIEEARAASAVAVASPIAHAYPEWQETAAEITERQSSRAIITVAIPLEAPDESEERPRTLIPSEPLTPARLPVAPPPPTTARLLTCAPIRAPTFRL
jgi:hypothetical protein